MDSDSGEEWTVRARDEKKELIMDEDDARVLIEMEDGAADYRMYPIVDLDLREIDPNVLYHLLQLPEILRQAAIEAYKAHRVLLVQLRDAEDAYREELRNQNPGRARYQQIEVTLYRHLNPKYQHAFSQCRNTHMMRKSRVRARLAELRDRITYLESKLTASTGLPAPLKACDLCRIGGTTRMVEPSEQPRCALDNCVFVVCGPCLRELRKNTSSEKVLCPGCRSPFQVEMDRPQCIKRHGVDIDPFLSAAVFDISDDDEL